MFEPRVLSSTIVHPTAKSDATIRDNRCVYLNNLLDKFLIEAVVIIIDNLGNSVPLGECDV